MLDALVAGTTDPEVLADLARGQLRSKLPALREALEGRFDELHALLIGRMGCMSALPIRPPEAR